MRRLRDAPAAPAAPRTAIALLCDDLRELVVDLAATGRPTPSPAQQARCAELAARCDDLALGTLASATRALARCPGAAAMLRLQLIADRVASVAASLV